VIAVKKMSENKSLTPSGFECDNSEIAEAPFCINTLVAWGTEI